MLKLAGRTDSFSNAEKLPQIKQNYYHIASMAEESRQSCGVSSAQDVTRIQKGAI